MKGSVINFWFNHKMQYYAVHIAQRKNPVLNRKIPLFEARKKRQPKVNSIANFDRRARDMHACSRPVRTYM
jgi:hypothetical protein